MCWRRRFYKAPVTSLAAGKEEKVLHFRGHICVRQLTLYYNADDTTGSNDNIWTIKIDGEEIWRGTPEHVIDYYGGTLQAQYANRPLFPIKIDTTKKLFGICFIDLGRVNKNIEVWLKNVDTANACKLRVGMVYDVLEDEK